jgi:endonuclease/exonuclease/phosphatase family metal-dependent hydrolase
MAIQECSKADVEDLRQRFGLTSAWIGRNLNKGVGIIARSPWRIEDVEDLGLSFVVRTKIVGPVEFDFFAVWACASDNRETRYIRQVHLLLDYLEKEGFGGNVVIIGDFNSNAIWDRHYRRRCHSDAVARLSNLGLRSAYHTVRGEEHGQESEPTLYFRKNARMGYHIDYAFLSASLLNAVKTVTVGERDVWIQRSDHMPVVVQLSDIQIARS